MATKRIKDLTNTAAEADLVAGNYLALDGGAGTKKLPGNCIAPKSVQDKILTEVNSIAGSLPTYKSITLNRKTFNTGTGEITDSTTRLLSDALLLQNGDHIKINAGYEFRILRFSGETYIANPVNWTTEASIDSDVYASYTHLINIRNANNTEATLLPSEIKWEALDIASVPLSFTPVEEMVDEKIDDVDSRIDDIVDVLPTEDADLGWINYGFNISTGEITNPDNARLLSGLLAIKEGDTFSIDGNYEYRILRFNTSGTYVSNPVLWTSDDFVANSAYNSYLTRIQMRNKLNTDADISLEETGFDFDFADYPKTLQSIDEAIDEAIERKGLEASELSIDDKNALDLWENGNIVTSTGASAESSSWLFPVSIRTKTFVPSDIYYVAVDRGWFLRVFKYKQDGTFVEWVSGANVAECFLAPQMRYRLQLVKEGADPNNPATHISVSDDSYKHVHLFKVENAQSVFFKYLDFGTIHYDKYYTGQQSAYDMDKDISYADLISAWDDIIDGHSGYVTKTDLGASSDDQHLYLYDFNPPQIGIDAHSALISGSAEAVANIPTIIITVCQHGNEKAAGFGAYYFAKDLLEKWYGNGLLSYLRHHVRLLVIPCCNPYGWDNNLGVNANGVNINRNYPYNFVAGGGNPGDQEYAGLAALDQPESAIINNLVMNHSDALHLCDYHTTGNTAPKVNEVAWLSYCETDDLYYNRVVNSARAYLKTFSAQLIQEYSLEYSDDTILAMMIGGAGNGVLKNYASSLNIIGTTLESTGEIYGMFEYHTPRSMKYSSELLGNWLGVVIDAYRS